MKPSRLLAILVLVLAFLVGGYLAVGFITMSTSRKVDAFFYEEHSSTLMGPPRAEVDARFAEWKPRIIGVESLDEPYRTDLGAKGFSECVEYRKNFVVFHVVYDAQQRLRLFIPTYE